MKYLLVLGFILAVHAINMPSYARPNDPIYTTYNSIIGLASTTSSKPFPTSSNQAWEYVPNPRTFAFVNDQTLFSLMDNHLRAKKIKFYRLVSMFYSDRGS